MMNSCITLEKRDTTQSASSNHKCSRFYIASFYFRNLIWESRVSDSSSLGKAGVVLGFVVLSDTVFRNNSQQGGPEQRLKCHGKRCNMPNLIFSVSLYFNSWNETWAVETYWRLLGVSFVFEKQVLLCESLNLFSNLPPLLCASHSWRMVMLDIGERFGQQLWLSYQLGAKQLDIFSVTVDIKSRVCR